MSLNILFIMQSYPSAQSANVLCDTQILMQLRNTRDYSLHILCMRHPDQPLEEELDGFIVHRVNMGWLFEQNSKACSGGDSLYNRFIIRASRLRMRVRQAIHVASYPCYDIKETNIFVTAAENLYQSYHFDLVVAEHYGFETMYAALVLKDNHPNIKYLQIFWDSISGGFRPKYLPRSFIDHRRYALEQRIITTADLSVSMTSHEEHLLGTPYGRAAFKAGHLLFLGIPYLSDVASTISCANPLPFDKTKKNLLFAGNLWGRNPEPLVRAISLVEAKDIVLWLISGSDGAGLSAKLSKLGVEVRYHPYIEHSQLIAALCAADVLVNFGVTNPNAISGKIIEYIGCCKPIITTYSIDNEACLPILRGYPLSYLFDERLSYSQDEAEELRRFLDEACQTQIDYNTVAREYSYCLPETYCRLFDELLAGDSHV